MTVWLPRLEVYSVFENYNHFKQDLAYEACLDMLPFNSRSYFTKLRLSAHTHLGYKLVVTLEIDYLEMKVIVYNVIC